MFFRSSRSSRKPARRLNLEALEDRSLPSANLGWAFGLGSSGGANLFSDVTDSAGNVLVSGQITNAPANLDPNGSYLLGPTPHFVAKYTAAGSFLWARGDVGDSGVSSLSGNNSLAVDSSGDVFAESALDPGTPLVKLDPNDGHTIWSVNLSSLGLNAYDSIAIDGAGSVCLAGAGPTTWNTWVAKLQGTTGSLLWKVNGPTGINNTVPSLEVDGAGNIYTAGTFSGTQDFDPGTNTYNLTSYSSTGDTYVLKLNPNGGFSWAAQLGTDGGTNNAGLAVDAAGNVYDTGYFSAGTKTDDFDPGAGIYALPATGAATNNLYFVKLDINGSFQWAKSISSASGLKDRDLAVDGSGAIYATGVFINTVDFDPGPSVNVLSSPSGPSGFALKLTTAGNFAWAAGQIRSTTGSVLTTGLHMAVDGSGNVYEVGSFSGTVNFDPGPGVYNLTSAGYPTTTNADGFVLKLTQTSDASNPQFLITGFPSSVTAGTAGSFTVTAEDANGNVLTDYTGTVHFTSSDSQAVLPADYTFTAADQGSHTFSATLKTAGYQNITATDTATPSIAGWDVNINVNPAAATQFSISGPSSVAANSSFSIIVTALDAYGNVATGYRGTVHFTDSATGATLPGNYTFTAADAGVHTFTGLKLKTKGKQTLTITDTSNSLIVATLTITVS